MLLIMQQSLAATRNQITKTTSNRRSKTPASLNFHGMSYNRGKKYFTPDQSAKFIRQHDAASKADGSEPQHVLKKALSSSNYDKLKREIFTLLLRNPTVDFKIQDSLALKQAARIGDLAMVKELAPKSDVSFSTLSEAISGGNLDVVKYFVEEKSCKDYKITIYNL